MPWPPLSCRLSIAFVRYRLRTNTEFAKEAMSNQKMDGDENLNIKWAYDDPNPQASKAIQRADADAALALLQVRPLHDGEGHGAKGGVSLCVLTALGGKV